MHNQTIGSKVSSRHFDFNRNTNEFVGEISLLQHGGINLFRRLWVDSGDIGFVMISAKTGKEVEFVLKETAKDADHDIKFWSFEPTHQARFYNPELRNVTVIILND